MKKVFVLFVVSILFLLVPVTAQAQSPTPTPGGNLPYDFAPYEYEKGASPAAQLNIFNNPNFINGMGKVTTTLMTFFDDQHVLGIFVVILLSLWLLWGIAKYVFSSPSRSGVGRLAPASHDDDEPEEFIQERRYGSNPYRVYTQRFVRRK